MSNAPEPTPKDFDAADGLLARLNDAPPPGSPLHEARRNLYAAMHASWGRDKFALRFGLRGPRTTVEELEVLFFFEQISEGEYKERFRAHATRPVDRPMLQKFFSEHEVAVKEYGDVLQLIVEIATDQHEPDSWRRREGEVDAAFAVFNRKYDLFSTELMTVLEFLTGVQADRQEPIRCADYTADSAHWLATLAWSHTWKAWKSCKEIAHRSRRDPMYLYPSNASALFFKTWIESKKLPRPDDLAALMRTERAKALAKFDQTRATAQSAGSNLAKTVQPVHFEDFSGHQFERLVFAYHLRTEKWRTLEWYGQSGGDLGRDIWGERAAGGSLCIQCVNRKTTAAKKITDDLDKIARACGGIPDAVLVVCASSVSAKLRDNVRAHAKKQGITHCDIWSGPEFEERLRQHQERLLRRFVEGVEFPDDPAKLRRFADSKSVNEGTRSGSIIVPGSLVTDLTKYNYVEYLVDRLTQFREVGKSYGQRRTGRVQKGATRKILERQLGGLTKNLAADRFKEIVAHLKGKIDTTAQGRRNRARGIPNYHPYEDHPSGNETYKPK